MTRDEALTEVALRIHHAHVVQQTAHIVDYSLNEQHADKIVLADFLIARLPALSLGLGVEGVIQAGPGKSQQLRISQSALLRSIANVEHALGATLLEQTPRGIEPTPHG